MSKYINKNEKLVLLNLLRDKIDDYIYLNEDYEVPKIEYLIAIHRLVTIGAKLHLDINELIDPVEYIHMKRYLFMKGYSVDD